MNDRLEFTFGPVQEFVAEARRTRDLWAGSFLLAYLSGVAINSISKEPINSISQGVKIVFPAIAMDPIMKALKGKGTEEKPVVGTLPNRFSVAGEQLPALACKATEALEEAWVKIEIGVWEFLAEHAAHLITEELENTWKRQVQSQWSINWVVGDKPTNLELRKNLRNFANNEEPGEKCTVCGKRSVLIPKKDMSRREVVKFWGDFVQAINNKSGHQFRPKGRERLCAICAIKRLFPLVSENVLDKGWRVNTAYPSTNFLAAIPFLIGLIKKTSEDDVVRETLQCFVDKAKLAEVAMSEDGMKMPLLNKLVNGNSLFKDVVQLDGAVWYESILSSESQSQANLMKNPKKLLEQLIKLIKKADLGKPSPFYCLLIMDGDGMGKLLKKYRDQEHEISACLAKFTEYVIKMQEAEDFAGCIVYSGGDDVLALLPVDQALKHAHQLRKSYVEIFKQKGIDGATISAALVFAHFNMPLQTVVSDAQRLLKEVAKESLKRDAFAVRVWKRSGPVLTFAKKWDEDKDWVNEIYSLVEDVNRGFYSSRFLHKLPHIMNLIQRGESGNEFPQEALVKLLAAEYIKERNLANRCTYQDAEDRVTRLVELATWKDIEGKMQALSGRGTPDGPMLIRFLSSKGGDHR